MRNLVVAVLGRVIFVNYNVFALGSVMMFFVVGTALMVGGQGNPTAQHVSAAPNATRSQTKSDVAGATTVTPSSPASNVPGTPPQNAPRPAVASSSSLALGSTVISTPQLSAPTLPGPIIVTPPTVPDPPVLPPPPPTDPLPPPPPPPPPFSIAGGAPLEVPLGGSASGAISTNDGSVVSWEFATTVPYIAWLAAPVDPLQPVGLVFTTAQSSLALTTEVQYAVYATPAATPGTYTIAWQASNGGVTKEHTVQVTVVAPPPPPPAT